jgi:hypothetical protein
MLMMSLVLAGSLAYGEAGARQFDLICGGVEAAHLGGGRWGPQAFAEHIRVDLDRGLFCSDECKGLRRIHRVTASEYALLDASDGARHWEKKVVARPTRTGEAAAYEWRYEGQNIFRSGTCAVALFSGFPPDAPIGRHVNDPPSP